MKKIHFTNLDRLTIANFVFGPGEEYFKPPNYLLIKKTPLAVGMKLTEEGRDDIDLPSKNYFQIEIVRFTKVHPVKIRWEGYEVAGVCKSGKHEETFTGILHFGIDREGKYGEFGYLNVSEDWLEKVLKKKKGKGEGK